MAEDIVFSLTFQICRDAQLGIPAVVWYGVILG